MRRSALALACVMLAALSLSACGMATVLRGRDHLVVQSIPTGATVTSSTGRQCTTPCDLRVPRERNMKLAYTIEHEGCEPAAVSIESKLSGEGLVFLASNAVLGPVGAYTAAFDILNGSTLDLEPNPVIVTLACFDDAT